MSKSSRAVGGPLEPSVVPPVPERAWLARAELLHEQTGMPWREAHELALTEHGIGTAAIDELIGECAPRGVDSLLTTPDDLREFCRAVLVFGEALREDAADALAMGLVQKLTTLDALDAAVDETVAQLLAGGPGAQREIKTLFAQLEVGPITPEVIELTAQTISRVRGTAETWETSSPSMDISKASNFERFVFDLLGHDDRAAGRTADLFGPALARDGGFTLTAAEFAPAAGFGFVSGRSTHADRLATIRDTWQRFGVMIDTHTADGVKVAREHLQAGVPMIVLETALPIKFAATIVEALGREPERPARFDGIEALPKRVTVMPADVKRVQAYITQHCG